MPSNIEFANQAPGAEGYTPDHPAAAHCRIIDRATGEIDLMGRKQIAICGFASSTRHHIPVADPSWIITTLNQLYRHIPRSDVHFDIHHYWKEENVAGTDHEGWIKGCGIPCYMADLYPEAPTGVRYPVERLIAKYGLDYFTSTVAFEVAWAIDCFDREVQKQIDALPYVPTPNEVKALYEQYRIGIYGIDLIVGTEYDWQKACVEFWIGIGAAKGIHFSIPQESALLKQQYRYGYEREPNTGLLKISELNARFNEIEIIKQKLFMRMHQMNGAVELLGELKQSLDGPATAVLEAKLVELQPKLGQTVAELQTYDGAQQECSHTKSVIELRLRGGQIPLSQLSG